MTWSLTHTWLWNTSVKRSTLELYLKVIEKDRRMRGKIKSYILFWMNDDTRRYVFVDNALGTLLNLPNNTSDNNTRWSRNLKRCQEDSPDLVTKVQLRRTKTSWADKVSDNSQFFEYNCALQVQLGALLRLFRKITAIESLSRITKQHSA